MEVSKVVGHPIRRIDGREKVTGALKYCTDRTVEGMLWAGTLRSPYPHARLLRLNIESALSLPGVEAVVTAKDIAGPNRHGLVVNDQPVLVEVGERVKRIGDPVAAVAATTREIVEDAIGLIEVEYEELPGIFSPQESLKSDAPRLHESAPGNLVSEYSFDRGDVENAFSISDVVVEETLTLPRQEHAYLEVEGGLATIDASGVVTVHAASQRQAYVRKTISESLGVAEHKVRVVSDFTGGGFGGKADLTMHALLALLAIKTGKPVKLVWSRGESLFLHPKRHPFLVKGKLGAKHDGTFLALEMELLSDAGAYASHSLIVLFAACSYFPGPYDIPNLKIRGKTAYTNNPISGAFRGYGQPQGVTGLECLVDSLAHKLGMDPGELRLKNALELGDIPGCPRVELEEPPTLPVTIHEAVEAAGKLAAPSGPHKKTGRGYSSAMPIFDISTQDVADMRGVGASVELFLDGTALVRSGVCEIGSGITTVLAQVAAEGLGLNVDQVSVLNGHTESTPDAGPIVASRQTYCSGNAVRLATEDVRNRLLEVASDILNADESELILTQGMVGMKSGEREVSLRKVAEVCHRTGVDLVGNGWFIGEQESDGFTFITTIADVEVDEETGQVRVLKVINAHDCGKALNPTNVKGQLIGGALMGIGYALYEDMPTPHGIPLTPTLAEYITPMSLDIAEESLPILIEEPHPTGPYGAKGVGEHTNNTTPAAILNAIYDAIGVRINEMPATPERIYRALRNDSNH
jgi:CO/xanthine dehydrogenase Mo-binding subunit